MSAEQNVIPAKSAKALFDLELEYDLRDNDYLIATTVLRTPLFTSATYPGILASSRPQFNFPAGHKGALLGVSKGGATCIYQNAGERLDQAALDVYLELVKLALSEHAASGQCGAELHINANDLARAAGRERGKGTVDWIEIQLKRLKKAGFVFETVGVLNHEFSFLNSVTTYNGELRGVRKGAKHFTVTLDLRIARLFQAAGKQYATIVNATERRALAGNPLAKCLHGYYSSLSKRYEANPFGIEAAKKLAGREKSRMKQFLADLEKALELLTETTSWNYALNEARTHIVRTKKKEEDPIVLPRANATRAEVAEALANNPEIITQLTLPQVREQLSDANRATFFTLKETAHLDVDQQLAVAVNMLRAQLASETEPVVLH